MASVLLGFWPARSRCECNLSRASCQQNLFPHDCKSLLKLHEFPNHLTWHQLVVEDFACLLSSHLLTGRSGAAMSFEASHTHTHTSMQLTGQAFFVHRAVRHRAWLAASSLQQRSHELHVDRIGFKTGGLQPSAPCCQDLAGRLEILPPILLQDDKCI